MPRAMSALRLSLVSHLGGLGGLILNEAAGPGTAGVRRSGPWGLLCHLGLGGGAQEPSLVASVSFKACSA